MQIQQTDDGVKDMAEKGTAGTSGLRKYSRYAVPWRIVIVYKKMGKPETYRGSISDLSLGGACLFADLNINSAEPVIVTVEIPPYQHSQKNTIVGVRCVILHSILSSNYGKYRVGIKFIDFNGKGEGYLMEALSRLVAIDDKGKR
jgi:c-di-GMP-binding flagellar brake protein YcgR